MNTHPMPSLPRELIFPILRENYFNHRFRPDRHFLLSCCKVNRLWATEAQPLLFRHVEVRNSRSFEGLKDALTKSTPRRGPLKGVVLLLRIWLGCSESVSSTETLSFLLSTCPNLYGLSVTFQDMWTVPKIPMLPPNIKALECCDWEGEVGYEVSRIMVRSGWHSLRFLTLRGFAAATHGNLQELSPHLVGLRLDHPYGLPYNTEIGTGFPPLNLRFLDIPNEIFAATQFVVGLFSDSLESIRIPDICEPPSPHVTIGQCIRLREFRFEGYFRRSLMDVLRKLPLEHLAFAVNRRRAWFLQDCSLQYIAESEHLHVVSCLVSSRPWDKLITMYTDDLQRICRDKRIELEIYTDLAQFRTLTRGDQVMTDKFPRGLDIPGYSRFDRQQF